MKRRRFPQDCLAALSENVVKEVLGESWSWDKKYGTSSKGNNPARPMATIRGLLGALNENSQLLGEEKNTHLLPSKLDVNNMCRVKVIQVLLSYTLHHRAPVK